GQQVEIEGKIRSIIAQGPLTYYFGMLNWNKKFDPMRGYAIAPLPNGYYGNGQYNIILIRYNAKKKNKKNGPYLWNLYDDTITMKHQGHNTAWQQLAGQPAADFFKYNKITTYGDDNIFSCFNDQWKAEKMIEYFFKKRGWFAMENESNSQKFILKIKIWSYEAICPRVVGLANNCAHYPDIHALYLEYFDKHIFHYYSHMKNIRKRIPIKSYDETPLDHMDIVEVQAPKNGQTPIITGRTGAGKSTILSKIKWNNVTTHGWLAQALPEFRSKNFIICLDEIHEMDEDALFLMEHYRGHSNSNSKLISLKNLEHFMRFNIDSGLDMGYRNGIFTMCASSKVIAIQRRERTGRTCDGLCVRLINEFMDIPFDPSISFMYNFPNLYKIIPALRHP
ncbi:2216_t:CDS:2, partial [Dentiscutata heterogama]